MKHESSLLYALSALRGVGVTDSCICNRQTRYGSSPVSSVSFSPDGKLLASASDDHSLRVWSVSDGMLLQDVRMPSYTHAARFSIDGRQIVTGHGAKGSFDKGVYAWAAPT